MMFRDRYEAGQLLAKRLAHYRDRHDVVVLGLPRGGVPVAFEVARWLRAPLDVFLVRKLGVPGQEELAMGAVATGDVRVLNDDVVRELGIPDYQIEQVAEREQRELRRQADLYRPGLPAPAVKGRVAILIDDGLATGSTVRGAVKALKQQGPRRLVVAVPVGTADICAELREDVDEIVCATSPEQFVAVGKWYEDFSPTSDNLVETLLEESSHWQHATAAT